MQNLIFHAAENLRENDANVEDAENVIAKRKTSLTSIRKLFHLLICLVFLIGIVYDRSLMLLCSYGMLILFALVETVRYHKIGITSQIINQMMSFFVDDKDAHSAIIMSHIYLLVGIFYPFWISNKSGNFKKYLKDTFRLILRINAQS